ncbi:PDZ domain-containing protein [Telmatocola sphagniphila]|uniref:PDZ domain-containing protein n=1 Tax=Telmatocola sphagniphila TaxID=1123043 RepID=A0A8E6EV17_9BACT|nr:PDZ domain-containing protein [Telmatocola sphagniphila]QVL32140.1 PDZ domain-containing protein [Telmatocola sphagniphila]
MRYQFGRSLFLRSLCGMAVAFCLNSGSVWAQTAEIVNQIESRLQAQREMERAQLNAQLRYKQAEVQLAEVLYDRALVKIRNIYGASLSPISDTARAQLKIPSGQGLQVNNLDDQGPAQKIGLKDNDILLTLADKPLGSANDLTEILKAAKEAKLVLKLLRDGKAISISIRPVSSVSFGSVPSEKKDYYIGVQISTIEEVLRTQLKVPANEGVVINEVVKDSPAEKIGLKKHDIILSLGKKGISSSETLSAQVQATKDQPTTLVYLRDGNANSVTITPALRTPEPTSAEADPSLGDLRLKLWSSYIQGNRYANDYRALTQATNTTSTLAEKTVKVQGTRDAILLEQFGKFQEQIKEKTAKSNEELESLKAEIKALHTAIEQLNKTLREKK